jgi:hypothetical protein
LLPAGVLCAIDSAFAISSIVSSRIAFFIDYLIMRY